MTPFLLHHNLKDDFAYLVHNSVLAHCYHFQTAWKEFLKYVTACYIPSEKVTGHFKQTLHEDIFY